jgi:hypothetical protein
LSQISIVIQIILALFLLGAVGGTLGDFFHVMTHTDGYPQFSWMLPGTGQPFWVPLLFGSATLAIGLSHPWINQWLGPKKIKRRSFAQIILGNLLFLLLYAASGFLPFATGGLQDILLMTGAISIWLYFDPTWQGAFLCVGTAILGTLVEITLTHFQGFFYYPEVANFYGVPSWLPWLYVAASVTVGNSGRFLLARKATS